MSNREKFEAWYLENWGHTEDSHETLFERSSDDEYGYYRLGVRMSHQAWQGGAELSAKQLTESERYGRSADITIENLERKVEQLAAENAGLKSGASYFSYGSEHNFEWHKTAEEAVEAAEASIDEYRGDACDGWSEEVDSICWGIIMQSSTKVDERPRTEDDSCDPTIDTVCDYALLPNIETPSTNAFLAEVRASGVEMFAAYCGEENSVFVETKAYYRSLPDAAYEFAAQLRQGVAHE